MRVDTSQEAIQVIIVANTKELIRQVWQILSKICAKTQITTCIGDKDMKGYGAHILLTSPGWLSNMLGGRKPLDLKSLKLIVFDEADEIFV